MWPTDHKSSISFILHDNHQPIVRDIHLYERKLTHSLIEWLTDWETFLEEDWKAGWRNSQFLLGWLTRSRETVCSPVFICMHASHLPTTVVRKQKNDVLCMYVRMGRKKCWECEQWISSNEMLNTSLQAFFKDSFFFTFYTSLCSYLPPACPS